MAANNAEDPTLVLGQNDAGKTAKEAGNPLEQIERLLTCPICLDRYKQPKLLACQHTFWSVVHFLETGQNPIHSFGNSSMRL
jgi:hypothetical protein